MVMQICANKKIPPQKSLADILALAVSPSNDKATANDHLQSVAQNFLGKLKHNISPFDKTSAIRLDVYKIGAESRKIADKIMNQLQSGLDAKEIESLAKELGSNLMKMKVIMTNLTSIIKGQGNQPRFMDMLESGHIGDYDVNLDPKKKQELARLLDRKQLRDLTKIYGR